LHKKTGFSYTEEELSHGYKEFVMPFATEGVHKIKKNALHIWPRGSHMMIALPNTDGSYTCTLFLANLAKTAPDNFENLKTAEQVKAFFQKNYADFCELVPNYIAQYFEHQSAKMVTLKCDQWFFKDSVLLMGDASHAIVPFFGQGMNSGFEDVVAFDRLLATSQSWSELFTSFFEKRKINTDAIADMAVENFTEMSTKTADPQFLYQKKIEKRLQEAFPQDYLSRYSMVSFSLTPYSLAYEAGQVQSDILNEITRQNYPNSDFPLTSWESPIREKLGPIMKKINDCMAKENSWT
jgi:kynurenine 3-monooxygenase